MENNGYCILFLMSELVHHSPSVDLIPFLCLVGVLSLLVLLIILLQSYVIKQLEAGRAVKLAF